MINNHKELILVKNELKNRVHQTEQDFINQYELISTFIKISGVHKNTKHEQKRKNIHALIIQSITEFLKEQKVFKKYKTEYTTIGIPIILTLVSSLVIKNRK